MALDYFAGCLGGCAGVLVGHPIDTIKVRLQTQDFNNLKYKSSFHCFRTMIVHEGVSSLYRGMASPLAGVALVNAIVFGVYGNIQRYADEPNSLKTSFIAGSVAGLAQSFVCSPIELAKTRLQLRNDFITSNKVKGPIQCLTNIFKKEGFRGLFRGLGTTVLRDVPGFSSYFVSYDLMMKYASSPSPLNILITGGLAGVTSWLLTFPIDTVKSRLQADGLAGKPVYSGLFNCALQGYKSEGLSFFSRGLSATLMRAFVMNAATFFVVAQTMKAVDFFPLELQVNPEAIEAIAVVDASSIAIVKSTSTPLQNSRIASANTLKRGNLIKSLVYSGTFTEAVCHCEMIELANELHPTKEPYYVLDECNEYLLR